MLSELELELKINRKDFGRLLITYYYYAFEGEFKPYNMTFKYFLHNYLDWQRNRDTTEFVTSLARAIQSGNSIKVSELIADIKNGLKLNKDAQGISKELLNPNSNLDYELDKNSIYFGDLAKTPEEYEQAAFKLISNYWGPFLWRKHRFL